MTVHSAPTKMTYQDLLRLPEDRLRHELIEGEHIVSAAPTRRHQRVAFRLAFAIETFVRPRALGEVFMAPLDVLLSQFDVVEPDVLYVSLANASRLQERYVEGAPDLAIEVLSPSSARIDRVKKLRLYEKHGVREYWLADPAADTLEVYRLTAGGRLALEASLSHAAGDVLKTPLLAGLRITLSEIFG
ncbi:MAG TPA: Uma2 family endonuclease [Thermoanaerobaculia bacterium]|nr:Uma2 family endonuclease [Thermoanaerobaculia bacterium]